MIITTALITVLAFLVILVLTDTDNGNWYAVTRFEIANKKANRVMRDTMQGNSYVWREDSHNVWLKAMQEQGFCL